MSRVALFVGILSAVTCLSVWNDESQSTVAPAAKEPDQMRVAIVVFPGVELLDFAGPAEAFSSAMNENSQRLFDVYTVGATDEPVDSLGVVQVKPKFTFSNAPRPDIVVVPGGGVDSLMKDEEGQKWILQQNQSGSTIFSVCNGASVIGKLGLLDHKRVTTHHGNLRILKLLAPAAKPVANKRFIDHGNIITAAGVSAGIDASLYVIAKTKGYDAAKSAASNMEYEHWIGFENEAKAVPVSDADGAISQDARVFEAGQWLIIDLIDAIQNEGPDAALSKYQQLVETAEGHQKEMLQEVSLIEVSTWLQDQSRDPELGLKLARFTTLAFPNSPGSFARYADACQRCRKHDEAIMAIRKAIELNPGDIELIGKLEELSKSSE